MAPSLGISHLTDLFTLAGYGCKTRQGIFEATDRPVIVEYTERGCALNEYSEVTATAVQSKALGKWMDTSNGELCEPDDPYPVVSRMIISRAFAIDRTQTINTFNPDLSFMYIVKGMTGGKAKVVIQPSFVTAANEMMHEAMNGYSIVFSAAIHRRAASILEKGILLSFKLEFDRVYTWKELIDGTGGSVSKDERILQIDLCF